MKPKLPTQNRARAAPVFAPVGEDMLEVGEQAQEELSPGKTSSSGKSPSKGSCCACSPNSTMSSQTGAKTVATPVPCEGLGFHGIPG